MTWIIELMDGWMDGTHPGFGLVLDCFWFDLAVGWFGCWLFVCCLEPSS
jgi:hypothetical protein